MPLLERLTGIDHDPPTQGPRIAIGIFASMLRERIRGETTNAEFVSTLGLTAGDVTDLRRFFRRIRSEAAAFEEPSAPAAILLVAEVVDVLSLAEAGVRYTTLAEIRARLIQP